MQLKIGYGLLDLMIATILVGIAITLLSSGVTFSQFQDRELVPQEIDDCQPAISAHKVKYQACKQWGPIL